MLRLKYAIKKGQVLAWPRKASSRLEELKIGGEDARSQDTSNGQSVRGAKNSDV